MTSFKNRKVAKKFNKDIWIPISLFKAQQINLRYTETLCNSFGYFIPFLNDVRRNLLHEYDNIAAVVLIVNIGRLA